MKFDFDSVAIMNSYNPRHQSNEPSSAEMWNTPGRWRSSPALDVSLKISPVLQRTSSSASVPSASPPLSTLGVCSEVLPLRSGRVSQSRQNLDRGKSFDDFMPDANTMRSSNKSSITEQHEIQGQHRRLNLARWKSSESFLPPSQTKPPMRRSSIKGGQEVPDRSNLARWTSSDSLFNSSQPMPMHPFRKASFIMEDDESELSGGSSLARWTSPSSLFALPTRPVRRSSIDQSSSESVLHSSELMPSCPSGKESSIEETGMVQEPRGQRRARSKSSDGLFPLPTCFSRKASRVYASDCPTSQLSSQFKLDAPCLKRTVSLRKHRPRRTGSNTLAEMQMSLELNDEDLPVSPGGSKELSHGRPTRTAPLRERKVPARTVSERVSKTNDPSRSSVSLLRNSSQLLSGQEKSPGRPARAAPARTVSEQVPRRKAPERSVSERVSGRRPLARSASKRMDACNTEPSSTNITSEAMLHISLVEINLAEDEADESTESSGIISELSFQPSASLVWQNSVSCVPDLVLSSISISVSTDSITNDTERPAFDWARCA
jgi:hypothetical protein